MDGPSVSACLEHARTNEKDISPVSLYIFLFSFSLIIHLGIVTIFIESPIALDDMFQYDMLGRSIEAGKGFRWYAKADIEILRPYYAQFLDLEELYFPDEGLRTAFRAPGYPFFLAFFYSLVSDASRFMIARLTQAVIIAMLAPLGAYFASLAGFSRKICVLSGIMVNLYPILLFYPIGLASENLYIVLGMMSVVAVFLVSKRKSRKWIVWAGLFCGLTMFTRSIFAVFVLLSGAWISHYSIYKFSGCLLFFSVAFGFCLPWSIRNSIVMRQPAFVESSAGYNLFIGYHPDGDGGFVSRIAILPMNIMDDGERDRYCMRQAIEFVRHDLPEASRRVLVRLVKFIGPEDREFFFFYSNNLVGAIPQPWLAMIYGLLLIPWSCVLLFGTLGLWHTDDRGVVLLVILFLIGYGFPHFFIIAEPRFHLAWVPVLIPFATYGWASVYRDRWRLFSGRKNSKVVMLLLIIVLLIFAAFLLNFPKLHLIMSEGGHLLHYTY